MNTWLLLLGIFSAAYAKPVTAPKPPHVILISLDTVSAGHMGMYGYKRKNTPELEKFGKDGIVFEKAYSQAAYTLASHYSIFTGENPQTHRIFIGYHKSPYTRATLSPQSKNLFEYAKSANYLTRWVGQLNDPQLSLDRGLGRGIDTKQESLLERCDSPEGLKALRQIFSEMKAAPRPSFVFFHTYYAHDPYQYSKKAVPDPYFGMKLKKKEYETEEEIKALWASSRDPDNSVEWFRKTRRRYIAQFDLTKESEVRHLTALYDAGIQTLDRRMGVFFNELKRAGLYDKSIIVVTSDHGESFGGEGGFFHGRNREDLLHVPLIVKAPGYSPKRIAAPAFGIDLAPTLLDLLHIPLAPNIEGRSLVPLLKGRKLALPKYSITIGDESDGINDFQWKLLQEYGGRKQLYKVSEDPTETKDLADKHPEEVLRLQTILATFMASRTSDEAGTTANKPK